MKKSNDSFPILVVDDNPKNLQLLTSVLKKEGYQVHVAQNGVQALKKAQAVMPGLILLDVIMPEMDGFELCRQIREKENCRETPIVFLTAKSRDEDRNEGIEAGANLFLSKPISPDKLLQIVSDTIG